RKTGIYQTKVSQSSSPVVSRSSPATCSSLIQSVCLFPPIFILYNTGEGVLVVACLCHCKCKCGGGCCWVFVLGWVST
ncbi:unnamed protein product, partial [Linum tenue]